MGGRWSPEVVTEEEELEEEEPWLPLLWISSEHAVSIINLMFTKPEELRRCPDLGVLLVPPSA